MAVRLIKIVLENFRNYAKTEVAIDSDLVLILGQNATGKTNFLESIYFLSQLKSFRSSDSLLVKIGEGHFRIEGKVGQDFYEVIVEAFPLVRRSFRINGQRVKRGVWKSFAQVLFVPSDLNLFSLGPGPRRRYLDDTLSQIHKSYAVDLLSLDHVLQQRKNLLEQIFAGKSEKEELSFWNEQLISLTLRIGQARKRFLDFLTHRFSQVYESLTGFSAYAQGYGGSASGGENKFEIEYKTDAGSDLPRKIKELEESEIRSGQNLVGPHREDFLVKKDGNLNIYNSSRGELRSQILAIKLLQAQYLDQHQKPPIILLDDVFSELDEIRRTKLIENLAGHQIFITTTEEHHLPEMKNAQILKVENGKIIEP